MFFRTKAGNRKRTAKKNTKWGLKGFFRSSVPAWAKRQQKEFRHGVRLRKGIDRGAVPVGPGGAELNAMGCERVFMEKAVPWTKTKADALAPIILFYGFFLLF